MSQWKTKWSSSSKTTKELKLDDVDDSNNDIKFIKQRMRKIMFLIAPKKPLPHRKNAMQT